MGYSRIGSHEILLSLVFCLSTLYFVVAATTASIRGFSLELIPRFSPQSPLYQPNLTVEEIHLQMSQLSDQRILRHYSTMSKTSTSTNNITKKMNGLNPDAIRSDVQSLLDSIYVVKLGIGTPAQMFCLIFDIGSSLTWVQVEECKRYRGGCMKLHPDFPNFKPEKSSTSKIINGRDPKCYTQKRDTSNRCIYSEEYQDGDKTKGIFAMDTFTFKSSASGRETVKEIAFGHGISNQVNFGPNSGANNPIAGVFSMGRGRSSFIRQIEGTIGGRFSYCLQSGQGGIGANTLLRFGADANFPPNHPYPVLSTPLVNLDKEFYSVNLLGISFNARRIAIPPGTFKHFLIDTGSSRNYISKNIYDKYLLPVIKTYFKTFNLKETSGRRLGFDLCYSRRGNEGFSRFPVLTFHFEGADYMLTNAGSFVVLRQLFCLTIRPLKGDINVFGSPALVDHRVLFDIRAQRMFFSSADCTTSS